MNICRNMRVIYTLFPPRRNSGDAALYTPDIPGDMGVGDFGFSEHPLGYFPLKQYTVES